MYICCPKTNKSTDQSTSASPYQALTLCVYWQTANNKVRPPLQQLTKVSEIHTLGAQEWRTCSLKRLSLKCVEFLFKQSKRLLSTYWIELLSKQQRPLLWKKPSDCMFLQSQSLAEIKMNAWCVCVCVCACACFCKKNKNKKTNKQKTIFLCVSVQTTWNLLSFNETSQTDYPGRSICNM